MEILKLPETGFLRLKQILQFIPIGATTWRQGVDEGIFPQPVKLSERIHLWRVEEIKELIKSYNNDIKRKNNE